MHASGSAGQLNTTYRQVPTPGTPLEGIWSMRRSGQCDVDSGGAPTIRNSVNTKALLARLFHKKCESLRT